MKRSNTLPYSELDIQIQINNAQLDELYSLLFMERLKFYFYCVIGLAVISLIGAVIYFALHPDGYLLIERYSALINIAGLFSVLGLIEIFSILFSSLSLVLRISRLIRQQKTAIETARMFQKAR